MELKESASLTSDAPTKLQSSRQDSAGTKAETQSHGPGQEARRQTLAPVLTSSVTRRQEYIMEKRQPQKRQPLQ